MQAMRVITEGANLPYHTNGQKPPGVEGEWFPRFQLASPYGPDPGVGGLDRNYARHALRTVRSGWEQCRLIYPDFLLGLTVYGSTVKGRAHENSDIDGYIFVDPDAISTEHGPPGLKESRLFLEDMHSYLQTRLREEGFGQTFATSNSLGVLPVNTRIIREHFASFKEQLSTDPSKIREMPASIVLLFCLQIGSGQILHLRREVMEQLKQLPESEVAWQYLMLGLGECEEIRRDASIYLPRTTEKGVKYFRLLPDVDVRAINSPPEVINMKETTASDYDFQIPAGWRLTASVAADQSVSLGTHN